MLFFPSDARRGRPALRSLMPHANPAAAGQAQHLVRMRPLPSFAIPQRRKL